MIITVHTDGSCDNSTGIGSYGYVITGKYKGDNLMRKYSSGKYADTTNNRMELKAIIKCLQSIKPGHKIDIYSDSQYCVNAINQWLENWISSSKLKSKQNYDLWMKFVEVRDFHYKKGSFINITWVRGHNGNSLNEMADKLASVGRLSTMQPISCKDRN